MTAQASLPGPIDLMPSAFDGYEVALCVERLSAHADERYTERVDSAHDLEELRDEGSPLLLMFTVYGHFPSGGVHAFADAVVTDDGNPHTGYEHQRQYALRLARTIDGGRTRHGVDDQTFDEPESEDPE